MNAEKTQVSKTVRVPQFVLAAVHPLSDTQRHPLNSCALVCLLVCGGARRSPPPGMYIPAIQ